MIMLVVAAGSSLRLLLTLAHYHLVASFVRSKPPGRKMVGGEIRSNLYRGCSMSDIVRWCRLHPTSTYLQLYSAMQEMSEIDLINLEIGLSI